jgi:hypothetical protein
MTKAQIDQIRARAEMAKLMFDYRYELEPLIEEVERLQKIEAVALTLAKKGYTCEAEAAKKILKGVV